jgi:hypothetical protein
MSKPATRVPRLLWRIDPQSIRKAFIDVMGAAPSEWICPCGCGNSIYFARDSRALWLVPGVTPQESGPISLFGAETVDELRSWIDNTKTIGSATGVPAIDFDDLFRTLIAAFAN